MEGSMGGWLRGPSIPAATVDLYYLQAYEIPEAQKVG